MVGAGGTALAAAIRRSYLLARRALCPNRLAWRSWCRSGSLQSTSRRLRLRIERGDVRSLVRNFAWHRRRTARRHASDAWRPHPISPRWRTALRESPRTPRGDRRCIVGQQLRDGGQRGFLVQQQHEELLADQHLELGQRQPRAGVVAANVAQALQGCARRPSPSPTRHTAGREWPLREGRLRRSWISARRSALCEHLAVLGRHLLPARRGRIADRSRPPPAAPASRRPQGRSLR